MFLEADKSLKVKLEEFPSTNNLFFYKNTESRLLA